jgi:hypothetical protein
MPGCIAVINAGSSSVKFALYVDSDNADILFRGQIVGVGVSPRLTVKDGLALLVGGVPWAGARAAVVLVLGIAQVPALIVTLPAIAWIWSRGSTGTGEAIIYTALLLVCGMATGGIIGMFVGATLIALGWQVSTRCVDQKPDAIILRGARFTRSVMHVPTSMGSYKPRAPTLHRQRCILVLRAR